MHEQTSTPCTHYSPLQAASQLNFLSHNGGFIDVQEVLYFKWEKQLFYLSYGS
jgi:hypothetical protein